MAEDVIGFLEALDRAAVPDLVEAGVGAAVPHQVAGEVARYGLGTHGVVCLGLEDQTLWKHPGHDMTQQELDKGVEQVLAALKKN